MTQRQKALLSCAVAAALLLSGCRKGNSNSGSMSSSNAMSGSSGSASTTQTGGWKTGLGILTEASDEARTGTIHTIAAAVLLDGEGKLADVMLDELEVEVTADGKGVVTMPTDYRTKRQKGDDYPLAAASSLKKGWAEQADDFADYLTGMTPEQASMLETDKDGKATDADLLSGCTIRVDQYRDAVAKACTNAAALGAAKGDRVLVTTLTKRSAEDLTTYLHETGLRVEYLHSGIDALERVAILGRLRKGAFDCLIGINLLREGLDFPEVALVAILDADKEGFLRSTTSLVQTAGRCARHVNGRVILYCDHETDAIRDLLRITRSHRKRQVAYNTAHHITPKSVKRALNETAYVYSEARKAEYAAVAEKPETYDVQETLAALQEEMLQAADALEFERAAYLRDQIAKLKKKAPQKQGPA